VNSLFLLHTHYLPKTLLKSTNIVGAIIVPDFYSDMNQYYWNKQNNYSNIFCYLAGSVVELPENIVWYYCIENINMIGKTEWLYLLKDTKIKSIQLFHNRDNQYYFYNTGLTDKGKILLKLLSENGYILDLSHVNDEHLHEICSLYNGFISISHCACSELFYDKRKRSNSISKNILVRLSKMNNVIFGIAFINDIVAEHQNEQDDREICKSISKQVSFFVDNAGSERVFLGPDFCNLEYFTNKFKVGLKIPQNLYSDIGFTHLRELLIGNKLTNEEIDSIFFKNGIHFLPTI